MDSLSVAVALPVLAMFVPERYQKLLLWLPLGLYIVRQVKEAAVALPVMDEAKKKDFSDRNADLL